MSIYFDEGYQAYHGGKQLSENPYISCGCWFKQGQWVDGWESAREENHEHD